MAKAAGPFYIRRGLAKPQQHVANDTIETRMDIRVTDSNLAIRGGNIFARQWAAEDNENIPIVLLHDSLGSVDLWRDFPALLSITLSRRVIAYDRLGFGKSSPRAELPSVDFIGEEARVYFPQIARALELDEYVLFGHSVGGAMALNIAAEDPNRCKAVITEAAQAFVEERTLSGIRAAREAFEDEGQVARLTRWHGERAQWVLDAWTRVWLSPEFRSWSLDPCLDRIECPVLAIHGDADEYGSVEFPRRITEGVRGPSQMELLVSCGHVPHREKTGEVLRLVRTFIGAHLDG